MVKHGGVKETLVEIRSEYWVSKGRQFVNKVLHQCIICKELEGVLYKLRPSADLSETRANDIPAFMHVGIDFAGPLLRYSQSIYLFVDLATSRAIHLELIRDLFTEAFVRALQQFTGRRGTQASITSELTNNLPNCSKTRKLRTLQLKHYLELCSRKCAMVGRIL